MEMLMHLTDAVTKNMVFVNYKDIFTMRETADYGTVIELVRDGLTELMEVTESCNDIIYIIKELYSKTH